MVIDNFKAPIDVKINTSVCIIFLLSKFFHYVLINDPI